MDVKTLGFVGVGQMGMPMANRLLDAGFSLIVFDVNEKALAAVAARGAVIASSPKDVADRVDVVLVSLPTPDVVRAVALDKGGLIEGSRMKGYVDLSTTGAVRAKEISAALTEKGVQCLDSPVSGGERGAIAGTLALMNSGPRALYDAIEPALKVIGKNPFYLGEGAGLGQTLKLANNFLSAAANLATAEAMVMGVKAGLDPKVMLDVINASSGQNTATLDKYPKSVINRAFHQSMKTRLLHKDVRLFTEEAAALGVPTWVSEKIRDLLQYGIDQGAGEEPSVSMVKQWEKYAGVEVGKAE